MNDSFETAEVVLEDLRSGALDVSKAKEGSELVRSILQSQGECMWETHIMIIYSGWRRLFKDLGRGLSCCLLPDAFNYRYMQSRWSTTEP